MNDVVQQVDAWVARGDRVALATVVAVRRSAPRPPGAKMAVNSRGEVFGAISGGCVEGAVVEQALAVLEGGPPRLVPYGIPDAQAWDVGLPCGGEIDVWIEAFDPDGVQGAFAAAAREGRHAALVTTVAGPQLGERALDPVRAWDERSQLEGDRFVDVVGPAPRLLIFGAVEYASHLARLARAIGWRPYVIDPRSQFATAARFPDAVEVVVAWPGEALAHLGGIDPSTYIAVLTHDPKIDDEVLRLALDGEPAYIGAMGAKKTQAARRERLLAAGIGDGDLERISAPIGLDLGGVSAEEVALAILAEAVAVRHSRAGGRLGAKGPAA